MEKREEQELIQSILNGETRAFTVLLERFQRPVYSMIYQIAGNAQDAEELTQDVFLKAFRSLGTFRGGSALSTWLYRIAWNTAVSHTRKKRMEYPDVEDGLLAAIPDDKVDDLLDTDEGEAKMQRLESAVALLQPQEKMLISLFYNEEKSLAEIASVLEISVENAKVRLHRTRKKLVYLYNEHAYENR